MRQEPGTIVTVAGGLGAGAGTDVSVSPWAVAIDGPLVYVGDAGTIREIDRATGGQQVIAGTGYGGTSGDGGPATEAQVQPTALDVGPDGDVYVLDTGTAVRRIDRDTGTIDLLFGAPAQPPAPEGLPGGSDLAVDAVGNVVVSTTAGPVIRWDASTSTTSVLADLTPNTFDGVSLDAAGNVYVGDVYRGEVVRIDPTGATTVVAGSPGSGRTEDGIPATEADLRPVSGVEVAPDGDILIGGAWGNRIRRVDVATGLISTPIGAPTVGFSGDGGPAAAACFGAIEAFDVDPVDGSVAVADLGNNRVRIVSGTDTTVRTVAGNGAADRSGDGGPAAQAQIGSPPSLTLDRRGNLLFLNGPTVRRIDRATGIVSTVVGTGATGSAGDGGPASAATLTSPRDLVLDRTGNLFIADPGARVVRRVDASSGVISTVAGDGRQATAPPPDGQPATAVALHAPSTVAVGDDGSLYIGDDWIDRLYTVDPAGILRSGPGARNDHPGDLLVDGAGGLLVSETGGNTVQRIDLQTGVSTTVVEFPTDWTGDVGNAATPHGMALAADGTLFVALWQQHRVVRVDPGTGEITVVAGRPGASGGDGGPAVAAPLRGPAALALDRRGNLYIAEQQRIRRVAAAVPSL